MVRDMHIRKFQKENLDDLFAVIREKPSGLACLKRFADEQLMGGDVGFFIDVEGKSQEGQTLPLLAGLSCGGCHLYVYTQKGITWGRRNVHIWNVLVYFEQRVKLSTNLQKMGARGGHDSFLNQISQVLLGNKLSFLR